VQERWTSNGLKPYFNDFVVHKGYAYGFDGRILACIDLKDGERKWKGGRYGNGQLVLLPDQDLLLVLTEEGELALVGATPDQFAERAKVTAIEGKTWNHPVLVGDILLVRNAEEMAAYRLARLINAFCAFCAFLRLNAFQIVHCRCGIAASLCNRSATTPLHRP
jgi:hypothetical protein